MDATSVVLLLIVSFFSSIIGTMIGMAMLILPPAMIFLGMPVHIAVATARFSMTGISIGNLTKFSVKERVHLKYVLPFAVAGVIGALISSSLLRGINEEVLKRTIGILMIAVSLLIALEDFIAQRKRQSRATSWRHLFSALGGFFVGAYIGIIGGGGATLIIFLLVLVYGLSFQDAIANQKAVTLPISIVTTIVFIYQGLIDYSLGVPLLLVNIAGGWVGAELVMRFSNKWLKWVLVPVILLMALRLVFY